MRVAITSRAPGVALALTVAATATGLSYLVGFGSGPVLGIVLGLLVGVAVGPRPAVRAGVRWSATQPLRAAVVVLGAELPLAAVATQGLRSLPGIIVTIIGCLAAARTIGRKFCIQRRLRVLIGVGTSICGASAIAATSPVIDADQTEVGYAVATIFLFNIAAVLAFPLLGHTFGLDDHRFGVFAGTAVNDLSSVVATASLYGSSSLHTAVIVKLARTLMIVPICIVLQRRFQTATADEQLHELNANQEDGRTPLDRLSALRRAAVWRRIGHAATILPGFLVAFAILAALRGTGIIPTSWSGAVSETATLLITFALAAVGLSIDLAAVRRAGLRPLALGATLWIIVSSLSLGCQAVGLL